MLFLLEEVPVVAGSLLTAVKPALVLRELCIQEVVDAEQLACATLRVLKLTLQSTGMLSEIIKVQLLLLAQFEVLVLLSIPLMVQRDKLP